MQGEESRLWLVCDDRVIGPSLCRLDRLNASASGACENFQLDAGIAGAPALIFGHSGVSQVPAAAQGYLAVADGRQRW